MPFKVQPQCERNPKPQHFITTQNPKMDRISSEIERKIRKILKPGLDGIRIGNENQHLYEKDLTWKLSGSHYQQLSLNMQNSDTLGNVTFHCNKFKPYLFNIAIGAATHEYGKEYGVLGFGVDYTVTNMEIPIPYAIQFLKLNPTRFDPVPLNTVLSAYYDRTSQIVQLSGGLALSDCVKLRAGGFFGKGPVFGLTGSIYVHKEGLVRTSLGLNPHSIKFNSLWNIMEDLAFDCQVKHNRDHNSTTTKLGIQKSGPTITQKYCISLDGILSAEIKPSNSLKFKALYGIVDSRIGLKCIYGNSD